MATTRMQMINHIEESENANAVKRFVATKNISNRSAFSNIANQIPNLKAKPANKSLKQKEQLIVAAQSLIKDVPIVEDQEMKDVEMIVVGSNVEDIDVNDHDNPQLVSCYINKIYEYLRHLETVQFIKPFYLDEGGEVTWKMRGILVDWLVQVSMRFHLLQETLYLTVAIIDRFLQNSDIKRNQLQLVGITAMMVAAKYEEMYAPEIVDFVYITDDCYNKAEIRSMERRILKSLDFSLGRPLPIHFLRRYSKAGNIDATQHILAKYFMELCLLEYGLCHVKPSKIGAAALFLSMRVMQSDKGKWTDTLVHYTTYTELQLLPVVCYIAYLVSQASSGKNTSVYQKFQSSKVLRVSTFQELRSSILMNFAHKHEQST